MIDKRLLVDSVTVTLKSQDKDDWGNQSDGDVFDLSNVRFDRVSKTQGQASSRSYNKSSSVLFVYTDYCNVVVDDSWLDAVVNDGNRNYIIKSFVEVYNVMKNKVFCYEIEVI